MDPQLLTLCRYPPPQKMLTSWAGTEAIARYAGADIERARHYDFDSDHLAEMPRAGKHFTVLD